MQFFRCSVAVAAAMISTAALADGPSPAPIDPPVVVVQPQVHNWSGAFVGGYVGMSDGTYTPFSASGIGPDIDVDGGIFGLTAGYNFQNGSWVYGGVIDVSNGPDGITPQGTPGPFWSCNTGDCNATINTLVTLRGRVGYAMNNSLFYATAGAAWGDVDGGIFNSAQQGSGTATGWAASIGLEQALSQNSSLNFEIMHVDLGDIPFGTGIGTEPFEGDGDFNTIRVGYNFRF